MQIANLHILFNAKRGKESSGTHGKLLGPGQIFLVEIEGVRNVADCAVKVGEHMERIFSDFQALFAFSL